MRRELFSFLIGLLCIILFALMFPCFSLAAASGSSYHDPKEEICNVCHNVYGGETFESYAHGNYVTTGDGCELCHSPHQAGTGSNSYKLLRVASKESACDYCHIGASAKTILTVYPNGKTGQNGHEIGLFSGGIPDSSNGAGGPLTLPNNKLDCISCHSVHGANTVPFEISTTPLGTKLAKKDILRQDPARDEGQATDQTTFCADCHNKNYDTQSGGDSHIMTAAGAHSTAGTEECTNCHAVSAAYHESGDFPHSSTGHSLLSDTANRDKLDEICLKCHSGTGKAVGVDY